jgi:hypothetical protein
MRPRSARKSPHNWFRVPFADGSGTSVAWDARINGIDVSGTKEVTGTTANIWATPGRISPAGDNVMAWTATQLVTDGINEVFGGAAKGVLILAKLTATTAQGASTARWLQYGENGTTLGGYNVRVFATNTLRWSLQAYAVGASGGVSASTKSALEPGSGVETTYAGWVFGTPSNVQSCMGPEFDRTQGNTLNLAPPNLVAGNNRGLTILCGHGANVAPENHCNATSGDCKMRDLLVVRFAEDDAMRLVGRIVHEYDANSRELPWGLA